MAGAPTLLERLKKTEIILSQTNLNLTEKQLAGEEELNNKQKKIAREMLKAHFEGPEKNNAQRQILDSWKLFKKSVKDNLKVFNSSEIEVIKEMVKNFEKDIDKKIEENKKEEEEKAEKEKEDAIKAKIKELEALGIKVVTQLNKDTLKASIVTITEK